MTYQRKIGNEVYNYKSYRENGKVKTKYLGKKVWHKANYTKNENILIFCMVFITMILLGVSMNAQAMVENNGRMPFLYEARYTDDTHFAYASPLSVKHWLLTDIFDVGYFIFSIGDVFITIGLVGFISLILWFQIRKYKEKISSDTINKT